MTRSRSVAIAAACGILLLKIGSSVPRLGDQTSLVVITWLTVLAFLVVGVALLATDVPPTNGWACLVVGLATVPGDLNEPEFARFGLSSLGYVLEYGYLAAAVALVLRYPEPTLRRRDRRLVAALLVAAVGARIPIVFTSGAVADGFKAPLGWPRAVHTAWLHDWVLLRGGHLATILALLWVAAVLALRSHALAGVARQAQLPLVVVTAVCAVAAATDQAFWLTGSTWQFSWVPAMARDACAAAMPVAVLAGLLRRRSAGAAIAGRVVTAAGLGSVSGLQQALRDALASPALTVSAVLPDGSWVDPDGHDVSTPTAAPGTGRYGAGRVEIVADFANVPLAAIDFGPSGGTDEALVYAAVAAARLGMSTTRLQTDLVDRHAELLLAKAATLDARLDERKRVQRDLHDGAQQRLLAVAASLSRADLVPMPAQALAAVRDARVLLSSAMDELREFARGNRSVVLDRHGLTVALHQMCAAAPMQVHCTVDPLLTQSRPPRDVETAVFFVAAEALTNAVKHARTDSVDITVSVEHIVRVDADARPASGGERGVALDGQVVIAAQDQVRVQVTDGGAGGGRLVPGGGLSGLADRVARLGGGLVVTSGPEGGTSVTASLPIPALPIPALPIPPTPTPSLPIPSAPIPSAGRSTLGPLMHADTLGGVAPAVDRQPG